VGSAAPDFTLRTLDGGIVTLSELRGRPVLINFWASWCLACRAEAPDLQRLYADYQNRGLIILGVNATQQDTLADAQAYASEFKLTFPIPLDEKGEVVKAYGVVGLPTTYFVDARGIVRSVVIGQLSPAAMAAGLELMRSW
jgi:cytochrome c biogenesis protein CcmG/thiol:disulfide interchange protein DsbE